MPYIKKIRLKNFKMFGGPRTTDIALDRGFTVFTGPNGSGKTNIVDAILFVLGELSARRLRAENFAKLIFHGSPEAGMEKAKSAKVVIQFDNSDGCIPIDTSTVTISREVYPNGQSVYRLNGRRTSRTHIIDMLAMAGISTTGQNIVPQGTITRMAEISSDDRRKLIENIVGIAQYDAEKAEAEEKLRAADISIRTVMGRIDEVQKRVEDLERQRNNLLRYNFIQNEIRKFQALKVSHEIHEMKRRIEALSSRMNEAREKIEKLRELRLKLRAQRREVENEWRKLSSEIVEEGGTRILEIQIQIGDIKSKLTELAVKIGAGTTSIDGLRKVRENNAQRLEAIRKEIAENRKETQRLKRRRENLLKEIQAKQAQHDDIAGEVAQLWASLNENNRKLREIEQQLETLYQEQITLQEEHVQSRATIETLTRQLRELNSRKERLGRTLSELQKSLTDLEQVQKEQKNRLKDLQKTLERRKLQKEAIEREIADAGKIADSAREAVIEFVTQRELAEKVAGEENALRNIEELGELGVIPGVHGRLRRLITVERGYKQAVEVAAAGWLDAMVVRDFDTAFTCAETLKRLKLGRIKIIPLRGLSITKTVNPPKMSGVVGVASQFVRHAKRYDSAVNFVLGDTLITEDDSSALAASRAGYRAVTINGNLYEAGGGMEGGYYRAPIDFSTIIPSEAAIKNLDQAVKTLQGHLTRREKDIAALEEEIDKTQMEIARLSEAVLTLENELTRIRKSAKRAKRSIQRIEERIQRTHEHLKKEKTRFGLQRAKQNSLKQRIDALRNELAALRRKTSLAYIQEMEIQREKLGEEIISLRQSLSTVETQISTLQSKWENVLKTAYENIKIQLRKVEQQLSSMELEVKEALQQKEELEQQLLRLEGKKEELSRSVLTAREEARKFTTQIDDIDKQLSRLDAKYERADRLYNQIQLEFQTARMQLEHYYHQLEELGYREPLEVSLEQLKEAESSLKLMKLELDRIGAVNQLALSQYAEQASRYKELSIRMNELEKEKQAILAFMEEIEQKKRKVFMDAFNRINEKLSGYFSRLTGGGKAFLKLDRPDDPFSGGVDLIVQFPGKPPILVSGASSGERSVTAVAFLFAIQDLMPATFYLFDEIDAHLDAFHVAKLGELLAEEAKKSQFLVITLKPEMVSKADRVYGVYEHKGVTHVVSTTFRRGPR